MEQNQKFVMMTQTPVSTLIPKLAVPTIISMLTTAFYNMADTFFVSQIGTSAAAAVGVIFSIMAIIQAIGFTFGMGCGSFISRSLGRKDVKSAEEAGAIAFFTAIFIGLLLAFFGLLFIDKLVLLLGATETIAPYAKDYGRYILIGAPYMCGAFVLNNILRSQGNAVRSMLGITTGGILNIILDPIFIFGLNMGVSGAAIATIISQFISFVILILQCNYRDGSIKIRFSNFKPSLGMYKEILNTGMPTLYRQGLASFSAILLNISASPFGDSAIAAVSIVTRIIMFINSALIGFGQGYQPVCGFNFGAKRYDRVLEAFWFCAKVAFAALSIFALVGFIFAPKIITLFRANDAEVIRIGSHTMRYQCLVMPLHSFTVIVNMTLQSLGYGWRASVVAAGRQGLFFIPTILLLPSLIGITGIETSQAIADFFTFLLAIALILDVLKELKQMREAVETEH